MTASVKSKVDVKQLEDIATLKADMITVKSDVKDVKKTLEQFIATADAKYATKEELNVIRTEVSKNESRLWSLTKEVATIGTSVALLTKLLGLW